ncbi:AbrB family transcriptional regulator [Muricoccus aerilatus]|uniref:AbrB family transcriptional regulator n=1 Tax=Muricoccus aerilatus TaxID=452982 RepID=UPI0005C1F9BF|nr:AbrB family transcriptional regulator [Roseomonas aerilata]
MPARLAQLPAPLQWALLIALALLLGLGGRLLGLPGSSLLGALIAAIGLSLVGVSIRMPRRIYVASQGLVGCLISTTITAAILHSFVEDWPYIAAAALGTLVVSVLLGWVLSVGRVLPGTTAIWGTAPGGASAMVVMAEAYGADVRLVALMQYLRVVCVVGVAVFVAHGLAIASPGAAPALAAAPTRPEAVAAAVVLALVGAWAGRVSRIPAGPMLLPMIAGATLQSAGVFQIQVPLWLSTIGFGAIGFQIGLGFTRGVLAQAAAALPKILLCIAVLIALCGLMSVALAHALGLDPLTAYLAMSPGGIDSVAAIGASSGADMSFVMALQTARMLVVLLFGPPLARALSRRSGG